MQGNGLSVRINAKKTYKTYMRFINVFIYVKCYFMRSSPQILRPLSVNFVGKIPILLSLKLKYNSHNYFRHDCL